MVRYRGLKHAQLEDILQNSSSEDFGSDSENNNASDSNINIS
jgi:hypothetical protein